MTIIFRCIFRFTGLTAVHLQNANAKFHEVVQTHHLGELENVYISVRQIRTQFYQNRLGFLEYITENISMCFFRFTV